MSTPTIKISVSQADATLVQGVTLTSGMQNLPVVKFYFTDEWAGLGKTAVFIAGNVALEVLIVNSQAVVPAECLATAGVNLTVGIYGADTQVVIPTVYCSCGEILTGTNVEDATNVGEPTTDLVDQMLGYAAEIEAVADTLDNLAIRTVTVNTDGANHYGIASVSISDSGSGSNRTLTFSFSNIKGNGIESVTWSEAGEYRGRIQITESNGRVTNFDALIEAINYLENLINRAEAWAVGTIDGIPVEEIDPDDPAYQNNAKYYAEMAGDALDGAETAQEAAETAQSLAETAQAAAEAAQATAESVSAIATSASESASSAASSASTSAENAAGSATSASSSETSAATAKTAAETAQGLAEDARDAAQGYATSASASATAAGNASQAIQDMGVSSTTLPAGSSATVTKTVDQQTGAVNLAFGLPQGAKGDKGDKGDSGTPTDAQVETAVDAWLEDNVDPATGYVLDRTLTQQNAAAPSDLVGDLKSALDSISAENGISGKQINGNPYEGLTENLIGEFTDGKYATGKTSTSNYATLSYATADITGYSEIELTCYIEPSSQSFPFVLFRSDSNTVITGNIADYETVGEKTYKISVPDGYTGIHINVYTANKSNSFVKGVAYPKKELEWLKVEYENLTEDAKEELTNEVSENISGIEPPQIKLDSTVIYSTVDKTQLTSESGYYIQASKGNDPTFREQLQHYVLPLTGYQYVKFYAEAEISNDNQRSYFCTVDSNEKCTEFSIVTEGENYVYTIQLPPDAVKMYLTYNTNKDQKIELGVSEFYIDWLRLKESNFPNNCVPQSAIIPSDFVEYKYTDSINKPFDFTGKKLTSFGDSITAGVCSPNLTSGTPYIKYFNDHVGISTWDQKAASGTTISGTAQYSTNVQVTNYVAPTDFIVIAGGINDFITNAELGEYGDTENTTFYGALHVICEYLTANYSDTEVIFITPIPFTAAHAKHNAKNTAGYYLNDYRNAIYEIATLYGFNVVDGTSLGMPEGEGGWNNAMCADTDGCHPTELGHKLYARSLAGKLC